MEFLRKIQNIKLEEWFVTCARKIYILMDSNRDIYTSDIPGTLGDTAEASYMEN